MEHPKSKSTQPGSQTTIVSLQVLAILFSLSSLLLGEEGEPPAPLSISAAYLIALAGMWSSLARTASSGRTCLKSSASSCCFCCDADEAEEPEGDDDEDGLRAPAVDIAS